MCAIVKNIQPRYPTARVTIEQIRALLDGRPFRPFRIELGRQELAIEHPHAVAWNEEARFLQCFPRGRRSINFELAAISALVELK
jgi:hypothetical protein